MTEPNLSTLSSATRSFFSGTLLSRVSGMVRDLTMAFAFGDTPAVAAFMVAFRFSHLLRRLFGEGPLQLAFIPHFEGLRVENPQQAAHFFRKISVLLFLLLVALVVLNEAIIFSALHFFDLSPDNTYLLQLTAWMMPSLLFICLYGLNLSLLQCFEYFFVSSFAPFICNVVWIVGTWMLRHDDPTSAMFTLTKFTLIGFVAQWVLTLPATIKSIRGSFKDWISKNIFHLTKEFKDLVKTFSFGIIGVGATQVNIFTDAIFARYADLSAPAYLWYSIRLEQLVLALFGMACVGTAVPLLSRYIKASDGENSYKVFSNTYRRALTMMIPCTFALIALGCVSVNLLYGHGQFSDAAVTQTTTCLWAYGFGLIPTTTVMLYSAVLYAEGDVRVTTRLSLAIVALNIALSALFVFVFHLGAVSIALATSLSAWINSAVLQYELFAKGWKVTDRGFKTAQIMLASLFACAVSVGVEYWGWNRASMAMLWEAAPIYPRDLLEQMLAFTMQAFTFVIALWGYAWATHNEDLLSLFREFSPIRKWRRQEEH